MGMNVGGGKGALSSDINITPFADVCLVLLIIFMVVTPMLQKGVAVSLPNARNPQVQAENDKNIMIAVREDGKVYYGSKWVPMDVLKDNLMEDYTKNPGREVYIKGDKRLAFKDIKEVLRYVQGAGFKQVGLVAQHVDEKGNVISGNTAGAMASTGSSKP